MRLPGSISEDEMVGAFLKAEIDGPRWRDRLENALVQAQTPRSILTEPDTHDTRANEFRERLLGWFRGWKRNEYLFIGFPPLVEWSYAFLERTDVERAWYANCEPWLELTKWTRRVVDGAGAVQDGRAPFDATGILAIAERYRNGEELPPPIVVTDSNHSRVAVLEGHSRATAWLLAGVPGAELHVIIGVADDIKAWQFW